MKPYLLAGFILFTIMVCADVNLKAEGPGGDNKSNSVNEENKLKQVEERSERQSTYHDMAEEYEKGNFSKARKLARAHLQRFSNKMNDVSDEKERGSAVHAALDIIRIILDSEGQLPPGTRFEGDSELLDYAEGQMTHARDVFDRLSHEDDKTKAFIKDKIAKNSERWIRAGNTLVSRNRLEDHHKRFKTELESIGYANVDNVLNAVKHAPQPLEPQPLSDEDRGKILNLIDGFYRGMISGDEQLITAVTGLNRVKAAALIKMYNSDLPLKGILKIIKVTLPEMSAENYIVQLSNVIPNIYNVLVKDIKIDVIQSDGTQITNTGNTLFSLKKEKSGALILELPERERK